MWIDRKNKVFIAVAAFLLIALVAMAVLLFTINRGELAISLAGEREIYLEIGSPYKEPGVSAQWQTRGESREVQVKTIGSVNKGKFGEYTIKYQAQFGGKIVTDYRRVYVVDSEKPVITLDFDSENFTLPEEAYIEEGYTATDNFDGDITDRVVRIQKEGKIIYTVSDTFGNVTTVERTIVYKDPTPPEITLLGPAHYTMTVGQQYVEEGCTAIDNYDGNITEKVAVSGMVDRFTPGEYVLTYSVQDHYGNLSEVTRIVTVESWDSAKGKEPVMGAPNGKTIYLTFDDGPGKHTPRLLDVLRKYNVRATFFVTKTGYINTISREAAEGHTVAAHTASHVYKTVYSSEEAYFQDLDAIEAVIFSKTGMNNKIVRFPGGSSNASSKFNPGIMTRLTQLLPEKGYVYFDWHVDSKDSVGATTAQAVYRNVTEGIKKCSSKSIIVLQHDIKPYSIDAVEDIIVWGLENGYAFRPLTVDSPAYHHTVRN